MIKSMTGYGRGKLESDGREFIVEIKSINHRYNDTSIKMPRYLSFLEDKVRQYVTKSISRGKIEVYISVNNISAESKNVIIDKELAGEYVNAMRDMIALYGLKDDISASALMKLPDIIRNKDVDDEESYWEPLKSTLDIALTNLEEARENEGARLKADILERLGTISKYVNTVKEKSAGLLEEYRNKLISRVNECK